MLVCQQVCLYSRWKRQHRIKGIEMEVKALPVTDAEKELNDWDVIMLGPQVRHMEKRLRELTSTPIEVINMRDYGMMNGEKVLDAALKILG